jgi:hypothetical protein
MAEKSTEKKMHEHHIPPEVREHFRAARQEMRMSLEGMLPPEFKEHRRKVHREMLLGWRSMIDNALQHLDNSDKKV